MAMVNASATVPAIAMPIGQGATALSIRREAVKKAPTRVCPCKQYCVLLNRHYSYCLQCLLLLLVLAYGLLVVEVALVICLQNKVGLK